MVLVLTISWRGLSVDGGSRPRSAGHHHCPVCRFSAATINPGALRVEDVPRVESLEVQVGESADSQGMWSERGAQIAIICAGLVLVVHAPQSTFEHLQQWQEVFPK
ncbi:hypothetical protein ABI214_08145 [Prescottella soli]|uniref:Uncharacterized protein n=1 Tax=Prescottella soli TaxID=1543852 RepID=A0ABW9FR16_9NOCA